MFREQRPALLEGVVIWQFPELVEEEQFVSQAEERGREEEAGLEQLQARRLTLIEQGQAVARQSCHHHRRPHQLPRGSDQGQVQVQEVVEEESGPRK